MQLAADILKARGVPVELKDWAFCGGSRRAHGVCVVGSNDPKYDAGSYHSLTFAPGALSDTAVSSSGRTLLPTEGGSSLSADLISQGVAGVKAYVEEPLVQAIASPSILFDRYYAWLDFGGKLLCCLGIGRLGGYCYWRSAGSVLTPSRLP